MLLRQPVEIVSVIRRMGGTSQSFLVRGSDRAHYVAKFAGNPQGNQTLINECLASHFLSALEVQTPDVAVLQLTGTCQGRDQLYFELGTNIKEPVKNGLHFGSRCPVDPEAVAILEFLPRSCYSDVDNLSDAGVVFAFDFWVAHYDYRQFIFARKWKRPARSGSSRQRKLMTLWPIDNGYCFGKNWKRLLDMPPQPFLPAFAVYDHCNLEVSAIEGAKLIQALPASAFESSHAKIPREWFDKDTEDALQSLLETLQARQPGLLMAIQEHVAATSVARIKVRGQLLAMDLSKRQADRRANGERCPANRPVRRHALNAISSAPLAGC